MTEFKFKVKERLRHESWAEDFLEILAIGETCALCKDQNGEEDVWPLHELNEFIIYTLPAKPRLVAPAMVRYGSGALGISGLYSSLEEAKSQEGRLVLWPAKRNAQGFYEVPGEDGI